MESKVVLITGASAGIGAGVATHMASLGYGRLALVARREERLQQVASDCLKAGAKDVQVIAVDLADSDQAAGVVKKVIDKFGRE